MMTEQAALMQTILERPSDDGPRLVYSDWLEENGDSERAEFIRLQCALANENDKPWTAAKVGSVTDRIEELHKGGLWRQFNVCDRLQGHNLISPRKFEDEIYPTTALVHRGFIKAILIHPEDFMVTARDIFAVHPIETIIFQDYVRGRLKLNITNFVGNGLTAWFLRMDDVMPLGGQWLRFSPQSHGLASGSEDNPSVRSLAMENVIVALRKLPAFAEPDRPIRPSRGLRYVVHAGVVESHNDRQRHPISAAQVAELYGLRRGEWIDARHIRPVDEARYVNLYPRADGNYTLPE